MYRIKSLYDNKMFKESSQTQDDADVILALFDPMRYKVADP